MAYSRRNDTSFCMVAEKEEMMADSKEVKSCHSILGSQTICCEGMGWGLSTEMSEEKG